MVEEGLSLRPLIAQRGFEAAAYASPQQRAPRSAPLKPRASARTPSIMAPGALPPRDWP
jgi:hypothetical protein